VKKGGRAMKKILLLTIALVLIPALVFAAAQKVELVACPSNYPSGLSGGGFVIFNNSAGEKHNLEMVVSLKRVEPKTKYDIYLFVDGVWFKGAKVGSVTTNPAGNVNFQFNALLEEGSHVLALDVTKEGLFDDVFETPGIHVGQGTLLIFE
jgi:hypothetical protein